MSQFINSIKEVKKNYRKYDEWEIQQADEKAKKQYLAQTLDIPKDTVELTEAKAKTVIRAAELLDTRSENNCQNMEQLTGIASSLAIMVPAIGTNVVLMKLMQKGKKISAGAQFIGPLITLGTAIGLILWGNAQQKEASRIGRYQAKHNELKDVKNFVIYTPEQIERAVEKAKEIPDEKERNTFSQMISEVKQQFKDKKEYEAWKKSKDPQLIEKLKEMTCTPEQLKQGETDKELIVDTVKDINIKAEEYSENVENVFDTMSTLSWAAAIPLGMGVNKVLKYCKGVSPAIRPLVSTLSGLFVGLGITLWGTAEKKNAARIGRYQARQELMKNPTSLLDFTDKEMEKAKDVKSDQKKIGFWKDILQDFKFLPQYLKDKKAYIDYKEKAQKQNEKIIKVLKDETEVTDKQLNDAKHLQEKVFTAFDEVDEMSQRYSEDVEAGSEIAKELVMSMWTLGSLAGVAGLAILTSKGKMPIHKIIKGLSSMSLDKNSSIKKAIDKVYDAIKGDKNLKQKFNYAIAHGNFDDIKNIPVLKEPITELFAEIGKLANLKSGSFTKKEFMDSIAAHLKKGPIAKWFRNMTFEITKIWTKSKASKLGIELPQETKEVLKPNKGFLIGTGAVAAAPLLSVIIGVPYAFNAWLTNIQKKAGKIGIMKAMEKIDDPKVFVNHNALPEEQQSVSIPVPEVQTESPMTSNLLNKFKHT